MARTAVAAAWKSQVRVVRGAYRAKSPQTRTSSFDGVRAAAGGGVRRSSVKASE
jgi:hypothetical protein